MAIARSIWKNKHGFQNQEDFGRIIPEELLAETMAEQWDRKEELERLLSSENFDGNRVGLGRELAEVGRILGLRDNDTPIVTGDKVIDELLEKQMRGEITEDDI